ncbi:DegT/DnrJ/EryC1/StrS family aminotransferase [Microcoleus sp.]|uniref:DegT/DnrJ/EryC1/StrS family aminotransferase n=1 Tax=Microcoleus sp. TaxID=44472 RepID=UPI003523D7A2
MTDKKLFYGRHNLEESDISAVQEAMQSGWLTNGPKTKEFEEKFSQFSRSKYSVALSSGTAGLHLCALSMAHLHRDTDKKVITTPLTFVGTAAAFIHSGYTVDFVDIDPDTNNIDLNFLEDKLKFSPKNTFAGVVPVHFAGLPIDVERLSYLAKKYSLWVIEDASHSYGAEYQSKGGEWYRIGDSTHSKATIFSMHPVKHITSGEGGVVTTNDEKVADTLRLLRNHSIDKSNIIKDWEYDISVLGFNYRLSEMQAAFALSQLARLDNFIDRRRQLAKNYDYAFKDLFVKCPLSAPNYKHTYHLYVIQVKERDELFQFLKDKNIICQIHYVPIHTFSYFRTNGFENASYPNTEKYYQECISLPLYPDLSDEDQSRVIQAVKTFYQKH